MSNAKRFMTLFAGLPRAYGLYVIDSTSAKGKKQGSASTLQREVTEELWQQHLDGKIQIGIVPIRDDATCVFGAIDIDDYKLDHGALEKKINKNKLPLVMVRSKSGGAHLYLFSKKEIAAPELRETLSDYAAQLGYANVEIFPKQNRLASLDDTGNWINMPYCGGDNSDRHALIDSKALNISQFFEYAAKKMVDPKKLKRISDDTPEILSEAPPCLVTLSAQGLPEGTRNSSLFNFGVYVRKRWPDDWPERLREINQQFLSPALEEFELNQIVTHLERKEYSYTCKDKPLSGVCQKSLCIKRKYGIGPADAQEFFGIGIANITRLETQEPQYYADFNGKRISFTADMINNQRTFRGLLIKQVNEAFMPMPEQRWAQFIITVLNQAQIAEAPPETRQNAELFGWLEDYCVEQVPAREWVDVIDGQVLTNNGRMHFRPSKWVQSVFREHRVRPKLEEAYKALLPNGLESADIEINGKRYRVWSIPEFVRPEKRKHNKDDM
jgi:hypothetical protein